ncbi:MAG: transketolase family protein [Candidatus Humimicrobiaceae bacterium]
MILDTNQKNEEWTDATRLFGRVLIELAKINEEIVFVGADSCKISDNFRELFPDRFYELGIAEQNACGFSAGLAFAGKIPFFTAISNFSTFRCYEQIRNDIARTGLNVVIVGRGAGLSYSTGGPTHNTIDEIGALRVIPGLTIVDPADESDFKNAMMNSTKLGGPIYLRAHKQIIKKVNPDGYKFEFGKGVIIKEGKDLFFISSGTMVYQSLVAVEILKKHGIDAGLINMHTIKPIDEYLINSLSDKTETLVTVEEHSVINGLGSAVSEVISENKKMRLLRIGFNDVLPDHGPYMELLEYHGLTGNKIAEKVKIFFER